MLQKFFNLSCNICFNGFYGKYTPIYNITSGDQAGDHLNIFYQMTFLMKICKRKKNLKTLILTFIIVYKGILSMEIMLFK